MEIYKTEGIWLSLGPITREVTDENGTTRVVTYRKGGVGEKNFDFYTMYLSRRYEQSHPRQY